MADPARRALHRRAWREVIAAHELPWHVQRLGCRAEYWFGPPPRDGAAAAAAGDAELEAFLHLYALNRGVLLTPFHNMALFTPHHVAGRRRPATPTVFDAALDGARSAPAPPTMP